MDDGSFPPGRKSESSQSSEESLELDTPKRKRDADTTTADPQTANATPSPQKVKAASGGPPKKAKVVQVQSDEKIEECDVEKENDPKNAQLPSTEEPSRGSIHVSFMTTEQCKSLGITVSDQSSKAKCHHLIWWLSKVAVNGFTNMEEMPGSESKPEAHLRTKGVSVLSTNQRGQPVVHIQVNASHFHC